MPDLRIRCSIVSRANIILQVEFATSEIADYERTMEFLLKTIEISKYYKGFTIPTEEAIEPQVDEEYPFAAACYLKFSTYDGAIKFVENINPNK